MFPQICTNSIVGHHSGTLFWYGAFLWSLKQGQSTGTPFAILSHFAPISLIWIFIFWISTKPLIIFSLFLSHLVQVCPTKKWTKHTKMGHLFKQSHFGMFICQKSWKNGAKWDTMSYYVQCMSQRSKMGQECPILECLFANRVKKPEQNGTPCPTMSSACPNGPKWDRSVPTLLASPLCPCPHFTRVPPLLASPLPTSPTSPLRPRPHFAHFPTLPASPLCPCPHFHRISVLNKNFDLTKKVTSQILQMIWHMVSHIAPFFRF